MATLAVIVTGINSPDPYDQLHIDFSVVVEGAASGWMGDTDVAFDASAAEVNAAIRAAAVIVAGNHSVTVTSADTQRVFGGGLVTPA